MSPNYKKYPPRQPQPRISYMPRNYVSVRPQPAPPKRSGKPWVLFSITVLTMSSLIFGITHATNKRPQTTHTATMTTEQSQPVAPKKLDFTAMGSQINAAIQQYSSMDVGVSVVDIKTGDAVNYGVQDPFVAASTAKMLTAIAYLHDVDQGKATLTQTVGSRSAQDALQALIVDSDNDAWNDFNNGALSHTELVSYAQSIGLNQYDPDTNTITPSDMAIVLEKLYGEKLLNHDHTQLLLSYMAQANEIDYITKVVPSGVKVYHKPGYLADRVHDVAIVDNGKRPYALVIFSKSHTAAYDTDQGQDLFKQITLATLATFTQ